TEFEASLAALDDHDDVHRIYTALRGRRAARDRPPGSARPLLPHIGRPVSGDGAPCTPAPAPRLKPPRSAAEEWEVPSHRPVRGPHVDPIAEAPPDRIPRRSPPPAARWSARRAGAHLPRDRLQRRLDARLRRAPLPRPRVPLVRARPGGARGRDGARVRPARRRAPSRDVAGAPAADRARARAAARAAAARVARRARPRLRMAAARRGGLPHAPLRARLPAHRRLPRAARAALRLRQLRR